MRIEAQLTPQFFGAQRAPTPENQTPPMKFGELFEIFTIGVKRMVMKFAASVNPCVEWKMR